MHLSALRYQFGAQQRAFKGFMGFYRFLKSKKGLVTRFYGLFRLSGFLGSSGFLWFFFNRICFYGLPILALRNIKTRDKRYHSGDCLSKIYSA